MSPGAAMHSPYWRPPDWERPITPSALVRRTSSLGAAIAGSHLVCRRRWPAALCQLHICPLLRPCPRACVLTRFVQQAASAAPGAQRRLAPSQRRRRRGGARVHAQRALGGEEGGGPEHLAHRGLAPPHFRLDALRAVGFAQAEEGELGKQGQRFLKDKGALTCKR